MRLLFSIFIATLLCSCGQKSDTSKSKSIESDTTATEHVVTSTEAKVSPVVSTTQCEYNNPVSDLGIGLVKAPSKLVIYDDPLLTKLYTKRNMEEDYDAMGFCTKFFKPDYGIMHFVCLGMTNKAYKVLINYSDVKYLPKTKEFEFTTWNDYISSSFGIGRRSVVEGVDYQPLRTNPEVTSDTLSLPKGNELFCPMEIKGDWIKVKYDCFYNNSDNPYEGEPCSQYIDQCKNPLTGWLRWRQKNELLISIYLMP